MALPNINRANGHLTSPLCYCAADEFVGSEACVAALVKFLCAEMGAAFAAAGHTVPPWRAQAAMLSKWLPGRFRDEVFRLTAASSQRSAQAGADAAAMESEADSSVGSSSSANSGNSDAPCLGSSCSPMSPLELGGGRASSGSRKQQKLPAAVANSAQRPLAVQTGFAVPAGASLLSRELGTAALQQKAIAAGGKGGGGQMRCSGSNKSVHFAADVIARGVRGGRCGTKAAPTPWGGSGGCGRDAEMPAIRTVKMTGRCR